MTKAMKMVAAAKLRRAQDNILRLRPYALKLKEIMSHVSGSVGDDFESPYDCHHGCGFPLQGLCNGQSGQGC